MKEITFTVAEFAAALRFSVAYEGRGEFVLGESEVHRPGLQLAGFYEHYPHQRVHMIGNTEMYFMMQMERNLLRQRVDTILSTGPPCLVFARGHQPSDVKEIMESVQAHSVPVLCTDRVTSRAAHSVTNYIERQLAPVITRHGVLMDIYGVGVMLMGESGMGKSETALELVKRGHMLVADDVLEIRKVTENRLSGTAPVLTRHLMEIRGIGIIDVRYMYGVGAVIKEKSIELVIEMEMWEDGKSYDRLGLDEQHIEILGVKVPHILVPVRPGRNLAIIVEVAARNYRLKSLGYDAAKEFDRRWMEELEQIDD